MSKRVVAALVLSLTLAAVPAIGQDDPCPCVPISYQWVATACETWNCAQSAMVLANGDPYVVSAPTSTNDYKWVVLRRIVVGSAVVSDDAPFTVQSYDSASEALSHFTSADGDTHPMMLTTIDGKALVVQLRKPDARRRAAGH